MKILELFSGTESFSNAAIKNGHEVFTVDIDRKFNPDLVKNILDLNLSELPSWTPDIIWASPPCDCFSFASRFTHIDSDGTAKTDKGREALLLIEKTISIISALKPKYFYIENPKAMLRHHIIQFFKKYNIDYKIEKCSYCQYGFPYMKPTDIFTNNMDLALKYCGYGKPCHVATPSRTKGGCLGVSTKIKRGVIPEGLCLSILEQSNGTE